MTTLFSLLYTFSKIGLFTIGGGYAMVPLMKSELTARGWLTLDELISFIGISEATPGPFAVNVATFVGMETAGFAGAAYATFGVILPSFLIILLVAKFFTRFRDNFYVQGALTGIRPVVLGLIASAAFTLGAAVLFPSFDLEALSGSLVPDFAGVVIFAASFYFIRKLKLHPVAVIGISATLGIALYTAQSALFAL